MEFHTGLRAASVCACLVLLVSFFSSSQQNPRPSLVEPSLSSDKSQIVFASGGDIWIAPAAGGDAHLPVSHPANESRPLFSPDGNRLPFISDRTGNDDVFVLDLAAGDIRRMTPATFPGCKTFTA